MTERYIPTTEEIKRDATRLGGWQPQAFDRWLAAHDAEVRAEAWDDGYIAACERYGHELGTYGDKIQPNPYRAAREAERRADHA